MHDGTIPERYVLLALRLDRWVEGLVDAYIGPEETATLVKEEQRVSPERLAEEAVELRSLLPGAGLEPQRARWMDAQLAALETTASRLAGEPVSWAEEVERCFGVPPTLADEEELRHIHGRLDAVIPGSGDLMSRYRSWKQLTYVAPDKVVPGLDALKEALRASAHEIVPLPSEERVTYRLVKNEPWAAYNWYLGNFESRVDINVDLPMELWAMPLLAAHEAYPGHHTERVAKDAHLLRENGWIENSVTVLTAPEALISEGIAMIALDQAFEDPHEMVSDILRTVGIAYDAELLRVVFEAQTSFDAVSTNAAALLHGEGRPADEVKDYLTTWTLCTPDVAAHKVRFIEDPAFRAYVSSYADGARLCRAFVETHETGFQRLLTEQLTTADLIGPARDAPRASG